MINVNVAIKLHNDGFSNVYIGELFNVSRQRIWQVLKRNGVKLIGKKKVSGTVHNNSSELYILKILKQKGFVVKRQGYNNDYDFLVNNKKVEVKYRSKGVLSRNKRTPYFDFNNLKMIEKIDFYIFICNKIPNTKIFIVPCNKVKNTFGMSLKPFSKKTKLRYNMYLERWDYLQ